MFSSCLLFRMGFLRLHPRIEGTEMDIGGFATGILRLHPRIHGVWTTRTVSSDFEFIQEIGMGWDIVLLWLGGLIKL